MIKKRIVIVCSVYLILSISLTVPHLLRAEDNDLENYYNDFLYRSTARDVNKPVIAKMDRKLVFVAVNAPKKAEEEIISTFSSLIEQTKMPVRFANVKEEFNAFIMYADNVQEMYKGIGSNFIKSYLKSDDLYNKVGRELVKGKWCYKFIFYRGGYIAGGMLFVDNRALNTRNHTNCLLQWEMGLYGFEPNARSNINSILSDNNIKELTTLDKEAIRDFYSRDIPRELPISKFLELITSGSAM